MHRTTVFSDELTITVEETTLTVTLGNCSFSVETPRPINTIDDHEALAWAVFSALPFASKHVERHLPPEGQQALMTVLRWLRGDK